MAQQVLGGRTWSPQPLQIDLPSLHGDVGRGSNIQSGRRKKAKQTLLQFPPVNLFLVSSLPLLCRSEVSDGNKVTTFQSAQQVGSATPLYIVAMALALTLGFSEKSELSGRDLVMGNFVCQTD